jgi:hypothetical protein
MAAMTEPCDLTAVDRAGLQQLAAGFVAHDLTTDAALRDAIAVMCASHPAPEQPAPPSTLMGVQWGPVMPSGGGLGEWEQRTGHPVDVIRCFPAGQTGTGGLKAARQATAARPGVPLVVSSLVTGRNVDLDALAREHQALTATAGRAWAIMDAEPEHERGRSYTEAQWCDTFTRWVAAHEKYAPDVECRILNLTGYQFAQRIDRFASIHGDLAIVAVDPYWRAGKPSAIQASERDLADAVDWATSRSLPTAWGEWGCDPGAGAEDRIARAFAAIADYAPVWAPYLQVVGAWDHKLVADSEFAAYRTHLTNLQGA